MRFETGMMIAMGLSALAGTLRLVASCGQHYEKTVEQRAEQLYEERVTKEDKMPKQKPNDVDIIIEGKVEELVQFARTIGLEKEDLIVQVSDAWTEAEEKEEEATK